jgi:energy-coupling factor transporter transmembrane protein EcfT
VDVAPPFAYAAGSGFLHRAGAGVKIIALFAAQSASFAGGLPASAALLAAAVLLAAAGRVKIRRLFAGFKAPLIMAVFVVAVRAFDFKARSVSVAGLLAGAAFGAALFSSWAWGNLFFACTLTSDVRRATSKINAKFALALSLMLAFIPRFFREWRMRRTAWKARAGKNGIRALAFLLASTLEKMILAAADTADALTARGADCALSKKH